MKGIEVIINKDGSITVRFQGFQGQTCFDEAQRLYQKLKMLGLDVKIERIVPTQDVVNVKQEVKKYEVL